MVRCATPTESFRWHPSHHPTRTHLAFLTEGKSGSGPTPAISPSVGRCAVGCQTRRQGQAGEEHHHFRILPLIWMRRAGGRCEGAGAPSAPGPLLKGEGGVSRLRTLGREGRGARRGRGRRGWSPNTRACWRRRRTSRQGEGHAGGMQARASGRAHGVYGRRHGAACPPETHPSTRTRRTPASAPARHSFSTSRSQSCTRWWSPTRRLRSSSAMATERCLPPVHPSATVR